MKRKKEIPGFVTCLRNADLPVIISLQPYRYNRMKGYCADLPPPQSLVHCKSLIPVKDLVSDITITINRSLCQTHLPISSFCSSKVTFRITRYRTFSFTPHDTKKKCFWFRKYVGFTYIFSSYLWLSYLCMWCEQTAEVRTVMHDCPLKCKPATEIQT